MLLLGGRSSPLLSESVHLFPEYAFMYSKPTPPTRAVAAQVWQVPRIRQHVTMACRSRTRRASTAAACAKPAPDSPPPASVRRRRSGARRDRRRLRRASARYARRVKAVATAPTAKARTARRTSAKPQPAQTVSRTAPRATRTGCRALPGLRQNRSALQSWNRIGASGSCAAGVCQAPSFGDRVTNGDKTGADRGGTCPPCSPGMACLVAKDCASLSCDSSQHLCVDPGCTDMTKNGQETDVDCGGPSCAPVHGAAAQCKSQQLTATVLDLRQQHQPG